MTYSEFHNPTLKIFYIIIFIMIFVHIIQLCVNYLSFISERVELCVCN